MSVLEEPTEEVQEEAAVENKVEAEQEGDKAAVEIKTEPEKKAEPTIEEKYNNLQAALREEREEKKRIRQEFEQVRGTLTQFEQLRAELDERRKQAQAEKSKQEFEQNPAEFLKKQQEELATKFEQAATEQQKALIAQQQRQQFEQAVTTQVATFKQATPDYTDALEFGRQRRFAEYEALGVPPEQRASLFDQESYQLAMTAFQQGKNPAEVAYALAKTWGYTPKAKEEAGSDKIVRLQEGQKAAQTLSRKSSPDEQSLLKKVEDMSDEEFNDFWNTEVRPKKRA